jgi:hypothetical protein
VSFFSRHGCYHLTRSHCLNHWRFQMGCHGVRIQVVPGVFPWQRIIVVRHAQIVASLLLQYRCSRTSTSYGNIADLEPTTFLLTQCASLVTGPTAIARVSIRIASTREHRPRTPLKHPRRLPQNVARRAGALFVF